MFLYSLVLVENGIEHGTQSVAGLVKLIRKPAHPTPNKTNGIEIMHLALQQFRVFLRIWLKFREQHSTETGGMQKELGSGSLLLSLIAVSGLVPTHLRAKESIKTVAREFGIELVLVFLLCFCHFGALLLLILLETETRELVGITVKFELEFQREIEAELGFNIQLIHN